MKTIFRVCSSNSIGANRFGDCYYERYEDANKDLTERVSILSRLPGMEILDGSEKEVDFYNNDCFMRVDRGEVIFEVKIEQVLLQ